MKVLGGGVPVDGVDGLTTMAGAGPGPGPGRGSVLRCDKDEFLRDLMAGGGDLILGDSGQVGVPSADGPGVRCCNFGSFDTASVTETGAAGAEGGS